MRRELAHGGFGTRRAKTGRFAVESLEHLNFDIFRENFLDRRVRVELAAIHQDHRRGRADRFRHRQDAEHRIRRRLLPGRAFARRARPFDAVRVADLGDEEGCILSAYAPFQDVVQLRHDILPASFLATALCWHSPDSRSLQHQSAMVPHSGQVRAVGASLDKWARII